VMTSTLSIDPPSGLQKDSPGWADFRKDRCQRNAVEAGRLPKCRSHRGCRGWKPGPQTCAWTVAGSGPMRECSGAGRRPIPNSGGVCGAHVTASEQSHSRLVKRWRWWVQKVSEVRARP